MRASRLLALLATGLPACQPAAPAPSPAPAAGPSATMAPLTGRFLFVEDFEVGTPRWSLGDPAPIGWRLLEANTCGGRYTMLLGQPEARPFADGLGEATLALLEPVALNGARRPRLKFDVRAEAAPAAALWCQAEARVPGGGWRPLGDRLGATYPAATTIVRDLGTFSGGEVELRFVAGYGGLAAGAPTAGFYLDDVQVIDLPAEAP